MQNFLISGYAGFDKPSQSDGLKVCYLTKMYLNFALACFSCIGSQHNYVIYNPDKDLELYILADAIEFDAKNTKFCFEQTLLERLLAALMS